MFGVMVAGRNGTAWGARRGRKGMLGLLLGAALALATAAVHFEADGWTAGNDRAAGVQPGPAAVKPDSAPMRLAPAAAPPPGVVAVATSARRAAIARSSTIAPKGTAAFSIDLFRRGDFVGQATRDFCVPAAILTMKNIVEPGATHSLAVQGRLYGLARRLSTWRLVGGGAEAEGWAGTLNQLGYGPYTVAVEPTRAAALTAAAKALRFTGRPVGLLMWRGAHAWVMSGFRATGDPAQTDRFTVTHVYVEDPWYPRGSTLWGSSPPPDSTVRASALAADLLPFRRPTVRYPDKDGRFVLVLPVVERPRVRQPVASDVVPVAPQGAARRLMQ
jgi:hypothetical protein